MSSRRSRILSTPRLGSSQRRSRPVITRGAGSLRRRRGRNATRSGPTFPSATEGGPPHQRDARTGPHRSIIDGTRSRASSELAGAELAGLEGPSAVDVEPQRQPAGVPELRLLLQRVVPRALHVAEQPLEPQAPVEGAAAG